jgi:Transposase DDE domain group 1
VCEPTGWVDLGNWPDGTRAICRREDAHPGAQLRFTDHDGHRFQVFLTDQPDPDVAALELRHRQRARVEDRIRAAKASGLQNLSFDRWRRNVVWLELVLAAQDLTCWTQALLLGGALAIAEPKTLRYRLLHVAARIVRHARRCILRLQASCRGRSNSRARSPGCEPCRCAANPPTNTDDPLHPGLGSPACPPAAHRLSGPARQHRQDAGQPAQLPRGPLTAQPAADTTATARPNEKPRLAGNGGSKRMPSRCDPPSQRPSLPPSRRSAQRRLSAR